MSPPTPTHLHAVPAGAQLDEPQKSWDDRRLAEEAWLAVVRMGQTLHNTYGLAAQGAQAAHDAHNAIAVQAPRIKKIDALERDFAEFRSQFGEFRLVLIATQHDVGAVNGAIAEVSNDMRALSVRVGDLTTNLSNFGVRVEGQLVKIHGRFDGLALEIEDERRAREALEKRLADEPDETTGERYVDLRKAREKLDSYSDEAIKAQLELGRRRAEAELEAQKKRTDDAIQAAKDQAEELRQERQARSALIRRVILLTVLTVLALLSPAFFWLIGKHW